MNIKLSGNVFTDVNTGRDLGSDIAKVVAGDYNPGRDLGWSPASIDSGRRKGTRLIFLSSASAARVDAA